MEPSTKTPSTDGTSGATSDSEAMLSRGKLVLLVVSATLFFAATGIELRQYLKPYLWHQPYRVGSWEWWMHPLERNVDSGLSDIQANIDAVAASATGRCLWIAGDSGLLAFSSDDGNSWVRLRYDSSTGTFQLPQGQNKPCAAQEASLALPSVLPRVYAAELPQAKPAAETSPTPAGKASAKAKKTFQQSVQQSKQEPNAPSAALQFSPRNLAFPGTPVGKQSSMFLNVLNLGAAAVDLSYPVITTDAGQTLSGSFAIMAAKNCDRLEPKGTCQFEIGYMPRLAGVSKDILEFVDKADGYRYQVPLSGATAEKAIPTPAPTPSASPSPTPASNPTPSPTPSPTPQLLALEFASNEAFPAATAVTANYSTKDGGLSWVPELTLASGETVVGDKTIDFSSTNGRNRLSSVGATKLSSGGRIRWNQSTAVFEKQNSGDTGWTAIGSQNPHWAIWALWFVDSQGWAINQPASSTPDDRSAGPQVLHTVDGGQTWTMQHQFPQTTSLTSIFFRPGGKKGWVAGNSGAIWRSKDGGNTWVPASRAALLADNAAPAGNDTAGSYMRFPAPWYLFTLLLCAAGGLLVVRRPQNKRAKEVRAGDPTDDPEAWSIGNHPVSDKPLEPEEPDALELGQMANGLSFFLSNEKTKPPLVIAVTGRWGSGKSSLMNLLKKQMEANGAHPVWFNAWHHQKEDQLLAALLQAVKEQAVPPFFALKGIGFRWRLLKSRLHRYWPVLSVICAGIYLIYRGEAYLRGLSSDKHISVWSLITYLLHMSDSASSVFGDASNPGPVTVLAGMVAAFNVLTRLLTAFGTNPASLLSSVSGGTSRKDLQAQTSFRQRFAAEFKEVTGALATDQRMLIVIDDLDRCRPEKLREVLEAVNFLVSSGDCFVVLGMARDVVEQYLSLSFRRVVDNISWDAMGLQPEDIQRAVEQVRSNLYRNTPVPQAKTQADGKSESDPSAALEIEAKRRAYARLYLEKLVQIEVSIPEPTPTQKRILFETEESRRAAQPSGNKQRERRLEGALSILQGFRRVLVPVLQIAGLTAALVTLGLSGRMWVAAWVTQIVSEKPATKPDPQAEALQQIAQQLRPAGLSNPAGPAPQSPAQEHKEQPQNSHQREKDVKRPGDEPAVMSDPPTARHSAQGPRIDAADASPLSGWLGTWPFCVLILAASAGISLILVSKPKRDVEDSPVFTNALEVWHPLVMTRGARNTPRTAKRFQNRVRYLAMRQRAMQEKPVFPLGLSLLRKLYGIQEMPHQGLVSLTMGLNAKEEALVADLRSRLDNPEGTESQPAVPDPAVSKELIARAAGTVFVPEQLLVAFAAIEEYQPTWIQTEKPFQKYVEPATASDQEKHSVLQKAKNLSNWSRWRQDLKYYRFAYLKLCSEVTNKSENERTRPSRPAAAVAPSARC